MNISQLKLRSEKFDDDDDDGGGDDDDDDDDDDNNNNNAVAYTKALESIKWLYKSDWFFCILVATSKQAALDFEITWIVSCDTYRKPTFLKL